jgi:phospholipid/cholesterol/gamma-HCH transport system substrate-binding protein
MAKQFQKKHANELVGIFVLLALGIVIAAAVLGPNTRRWFTPSRKLIIRLPPAGSLGLRNGADVLILGSVVGSVDDIVVNDTGQVEADVSIRGNFIRFVRQDSHAIIRKPLGIGDATIDITRGTGAPLPLTGAAIVASADKAPTEMLEETLGDIRTQALPAIQEVRTAVSEYTELARDLRAQQPGLADAISHFNQLAENIQAGKGVAGLMLSDPNEAQTVRQSILKMNDALEDARSTAASLRRVSAGLPDLEKSVQRSADLTPGLLLQIDESFRQIQHLTATMQHNWLLGGNSPAAVPNRTIGVDEVGTDR